MMSFLWLLSAAQAAGIDADIELIHGYFGSGSIPGISSPDIEEFGAINIGFFSQYIRDPLVLYEENLDQGAVISRRQNTSIGATFDLSPRVALDLSMPVIIQWETELPALSRSGIGIGDMRGGARIKLYDSQYAVLGFYGSALFPTSTAASWMGDVEMAGIASC